MRNTLRSGAHRVLTLSIVLSFYNLVPKRQREEDEPETSRKTLKLDVEPEASGPKGMEERIIDID